MLSENLFKIISHLQSSEDDEEVIIDTSEPSLSDRGCDETYVVRVHQNNSLLNLLVGIPMDYSISWETVEYIDMLRAHMPNTICPLNVPGDGNCLLHAISVAIWGNIKYHANLRELLREELIQFEDFYRSSVDKAKEDEESQGFTKAEFEKIVADANSDRAFLGFVHIFALSNILKRPIIVYAGSSDMQAWGIHEEGVAGTFLPTRHGASECCAKSIALGWSNGHKNHFVPICPTENAKDENWEWPKLDIVFKKTLKQETVDHYFSYSNISNEKKKFFQIVSETSKRQQNLIANHQRLSINYSIEDDPLETAKKLITQLPSELNPDFDFIVSQINLKREAMLAHRGVNKVSPIRRKYPKIQYPLDYIYTTMPPNYNPKAVLKKILQFNDEIILKFKTPSTSILHKKGSKYFLSENDKVLLESLFNVLMSRSPNFDQNQESLDLVLQLLSWPLEYIWPVIDLIRVLMLYEPAASYYSKMKDGRVSLITLLLAILKVPNLNGNCLLLCLKLIINLFRQKCFHLSLIMDSNLIISQLTGLMSQLNIESDPKASLSCSQIFFNYSILLENGPQYRLQTHYDNIKILIKSSIHLLKNDRVSEEQKTLILVTLAAIIHNDCKIFLPLTNFEPFLQSQNPKLREYASYIIECQNSQSIPSLLVDGKN